MLDNFIPYHALLWYTIVIPNIMLNHPVLWCPLPVSPCIILYSSYVSSCIILYYSYFIMLHYTVLLLYYTVPLIQSYCIMIHFLCVILHYVLPPRISPCIILCSSCITLYYPVPFMMFPSPVCCCMICVLSIITCRTVLYHVDLLNHQAIRTSLGFAGLYY